MLATSEAVYITAKYASSMVKVTKQAHITYPDPYGHTFLSQDQFFT